MSEPVTSVRRALALSFAERYVLMALALFGNILVARMLTPHEIGIYSVSVAVIGVAQVLRDFGIGSFLIQEKNLDDDHVRTAFAFMLIIGGALFLITFLAAPWAGRFYAEPLLVDTLRIGALNFLVLPFCSISLSLLRREMAFNRIVSVNLVAAVAGFATIFTLAYKGFGADSMAVGSVLANIVTGAGAWIARKDRKFLLPGLTHWRTLLRFGAQTSASSVVTTISMDINDLALGKILGFAPVAMLSRAQGLMHLFNRDLMAAARNVAFPSFARTHREGEPLESRYIAAVTAVTVAAWPFYGFTALFSLEIIRLMFGPQWDEAARLVPFFCAAGALAATCNLILNAVMAVGRVDLVTRAELLFQPFRALLLIGAALVFESLMACAIAFLIAFAIHAPFLYIVKAHCISNDLAALSEKLWLSVKVSTASLLLPAVIAVYSGPGRTDPIDTPLFLAAALLCIVGWIIALFVFRHPVSDDPLFKKLTQKLLHVPKEAR